MESAEDEFERRIAAIHGLDGSRAQAEATPVNVRHAEFNAMVEVFLGAGYDPEKLRQVEGLQVALDQQHADLSHRHDQGELSDGEYVDAANAAMVETFRKCEKVLGQEDFRKLFGVLPHEVTGLIDREAFLVKHSVQPPTQFTVDTTALHDIYANFCRVTGTPEELVLDFGLNTQMTANDLVKLTDRLVLSFYTAKRLLSALRMALQQHENTYGVLEVDITKRAPRVGNKTPGLRQ